MDGFWEIVERIWENPLVKALVYLLVAFAAAFLASFIVKQLLKLLKLDKKLVKWEIYGGKDKAAIKFIGKIVFLIVFLLFMPMVLNSLGLDSVSEPIHDFVGAFVEYIPRVVAALILVFVGIFLGQILSQLIAALLRKTEIDILTERLGKEGEKSVSISGIVGKIVYALIVLVAVVQALTVLNIEAISAPALSVINAIFGAIPDILLAAIIIAIGIFISKIVYDLVFNLLKGVRLDGTVAKLLPKMKSTETASRVIATILRVLILLFVIAEGVDILGLEVLSGAISVVVAYLPMLIKAVVIALIVFFGATFAESFIKKATGVSEGVLLAVKVIIYTVGAFMVLSQLDFAATIVNYAFVIILGAVAVAFAIAFGIGGRDFAKNTLSGLKLGKKENKSEKEEQSEE